MNAGLRHRALLIGNWAYTDPDGRLRPLVGPRKDLELMRQALTHSRCGWFKAEDVEVHDNLESRRIAEKLFDFTESARPGDVLLIYYSGHGERIYRELGFCGVDVQYSKRQAQCFKARELRDFLRECRASHVVIVLDCCFAGQYTKGAVEDEVIRDSFAGPTNTFVLSSGGNEPVDDATLAGEPSPFTKALTTILLDPKSVGSDGALSVDQAYDALMAWPDLPTKPVRSVQGSTIPLARRDPPEPASNGQAGWTDVSFDTVELSLGQDQVDVVWGGDTARSHRDLADFDSNRRAMIRRLGQLADAVIRHEEYQREARWQTAVAKAWECAGVSLFEACLPAELQGRIGSHLRRSGSVLRVRLRFTDDAHLAEYPWEYLELPRAFREGSDVLPLGLASGVLIERVLPHGNRNGRGPAEARGTTVGVLNSLPDRYDGPGHRLCQELRAMSTARLLWDLHGPRATWSGFINALAHNPDYLVVYAPVRRVDKAVQIGFRRAGNEWDPRSVSSFVRELGAENRQLRLLILVTVAAAPGQDSFRATLQLAREMALGHGVQVAFVCHQPGFERFVDDLMDPAPGTFPGLLLGAAVDGHSLQQSFYFARRQVTRMISDDLAPRFGVPGCYLLPESVHRTPSPAPGPSSGVAGRSGSVSTAEKS